MNISTLKQKLIVKGSLRTDWRHDNWNGLKIVFPTDFREFIGFYGLGELNGDIYIWSPFASSWDNLVNSELECYKMVRDVRDRKITLYPSAGGILPFGSSGGGTTLFWLTEGRPDQWKIVVHDATLDGLRRYDVGMLEFIYNLITIPDYCDSLGDQTEAPHFIPDHWY